MGLFHDVLAGMETEGEEPNPIVAELTSAYDEDFSVPAAKIAELEAQLAEVSEMIRELKSRNYDLLVALDANAGEGSNSDNSENEDNDEDITIDDLFEDGES